MTINPSLSQTLQTAISLVHLDDISLAYDDAERLLATVRGTLSAGHLDEDQQEGLEMIEQELELGTIPEIDDAIGNGWADDPNGERVLELMEDLVGRLSDTVFDYTEELDRTGRAA